MDGNYTRLPEGYLLHGTYRIKRVLGQGGFGITYLAHDTGLDRMVAIKEFFPKDFCDRDASTSRVRPGTQSNSEFVERLKNKFLKEARNIAGMEHPGIIRIYAAFEANNTAYYVMEYIDGCSLADLVGDEGPMPPARALQYVSAIGNALEFVHSRRVNHLDVKPANIMVRRRNNQAILIDFGLAKKYDSDGNQTSSTPTGISHGYAPIEQYYADGVSEFSPQTDLYSLAATFYFLVTGNVPPQAGMLIEKRLSFPDSFPEALKAPVCRAMASARADRHETVSEFINHLLNPAPDEPDDQTDKKESKPTVGKTEPSPEIESSDKDKKEVAEGGNDGNGGNNDHRIPNTDRHRRTVEDDDDKKDKKDEGGKNLKLVIIALLLLAVAIAVGVIYFSSPAEHDDYAAQDLASEPAEEVAVMDADSTDITTIPEYDSPTVSDSLHTSIKKEDEKVTDRADDKKNEPDRKDGYEKPSPGVESARNENPPVAPQAPAPQSNDDELFAKASSISKYKELADRGYAKAYAPLAAMYLKARNYSSADSYARKALHANVGRAEAIKVINALDVLGWYDDPSTGGKPKF